MKLIVKLMLSFDLSAIDIVLVVAAVVLLLLYVTKLTRPTAKPQPCTEEKKTETYIKEPTYEKVEASSKTVPSGCLHYFGYLRGVSRSSSIPDECYVCSRMTQCAVQARE